MKISTHHKTAKKGFTLIELLVVIAIIAALGGLSFGPIMNHLTNAEVKKAQNVCKQLTGAISTFESEYDSLPYTGSSYPSSDEEIETDTADFLEVIMGLEDEINDKQKQFFTTDQAKGSKDGLVYTGATLNSLLDKWGNPYTIILDYDSDGVVDASKIATGTSTATTEATAYKKELHIQDAVAATPGPDKEFNDKQDANSW